MKKSQFLSFFLCLMLFTGLLAAPVSAQVLYDYPTSEGNTIESPSAMLVYLGTTAEQDVVLYEKDADTRYSPGALVRVMVGAYAMEVIEEKNLDMETTTGTYTLQMFNHTIAGTGLGTANMAFGETWTLKDLLSVSMIQTAADAALTLAVTLCGDQATFVQGMNDLAEELGCTNSHFTNVTGLHDENQYMSPRDVIIITRYAADFPALRKMMEMSQYTAHPVSGGEARSWPSSNELLRSTSSNYYKDAVYGRTGYADGYSIVAMGAKAGYEYMAVAMGAQKDENGAATVHFSDAKKLLQWGFSDFSYKTLLNKNEPVDRIPVSLCWEKDTIAAVPVEEFSTIVASGVDSSQVIRKVIRYQDTLTAPVEKDTPLGKVELYLNLDQKIGEVELVAAESAEKNQLLAAWAQFLLFVKSPWFYIGLGALLLLLLGYVILVVVHNRRRKRRKMKRVKKFK